MKAMPKILAKIYPRSKKLEKILVVSGKNIRPITKNTNHHLITNIMSEAGILPNHFGKIFNRKKIFPQRFTLFII